jgi:hypothetical protein
MSVRIGRFDFEGPFDSPENLKSDPGVYAVISTFRGRSSVLDVGEGGNVRESVTTSDRHNHWLDVSRNQGGELLFAANYTPGLEGKSRKLIEQEIRTQFELAGE